MCLDVLADGAVGAGEATVFSPVPKKEPTLRFSRGFLYCFCISFGMQSNLRARIQLFASVCPPLMCSF